MIRRLLETIGEFGAYVGRTFAILFRCPPRLRHVLDQMDRAGVGSITIVNVCAIFTGMVLTLQTAHGLSRFGAKGFISRIVALAFLREMGPVFTALMVAGRVGSGIAAELGSMVVTEQVDALRAMGADPIRHLVAPRVAATTLMVPVLTVIADLFGIASGLLVAILFLGVSPHYYLGNAIEAATLSDMMSGVGKAVFFGAAIGLVSTFIGLRTERGTEGVGRSTTIAMVACAYAILVSDFLMTKAMLALG
ncbi:MAG: ABC transporter permease [Planctomycetes bacterium]|nr:ABC transporter permease [Planctomycetota bacterium]